MPAHTFSTTMFSDPTAEWRGKPFWCWNGKLHKDELIRQIHVLKAMGMGGFFMHSRTGLATQYLGEEWFDLINTCAEEGAKLGMESWLYDEDRWPSGTAGGMVTANPEYRMKFIYMEKLPAHTFDYVSWEEAKEHALGVWSCRVENDIDIYEVEPVTAATSVGELEGKTILAFCVVPMASGSFYNGNTYVDTMKREATDEYIRLTHEAYKAHCAHHFGKAIRGIFTDEPHRGPFMSGFSVTDGTCDDPFCLVPWTDTLFDAFADIHGRRVEDHLPALFLREQGVRVSPVKAQYAETALQLFLDNFARPYYEWCQANDLLVSGHVLHENSLSCQVSTNGSVQRYYPLMHVPGIDYLGEHGRDYWVAKQVDSVARQFDQPWILSELYGCTGWQMNFESHKAVGAWQALFGVNLRCHHLSWYTMAGESKRDYPASILHQSPWFREYEAVETWFSRLGYFRSQGSPCCDLLVLNPVESVWGRVYPGSIRGMSTADPDIRALESHYSRLFHLLAGNQIDFDYGDEGLLAEHGSVERQEGRALMRLGSMTYTTVLISGVETIRGTTLDILKAFAAAGGKVIVAGDAPAYVDGLPSESFRDLVCATCECSDAGLVPTLLGHTPQSVRVRDHRTGVTARDVFCQLRAGKDACYLTILNSNRDTGCNIDIELDGITGYIEEWDLESGDAVQRKGVTGDVLTFSSRLETSQVRCFRIVPHTELPLAPPDPGNASATETLLLDFPVRYSLEDPNICVLDTPFWSINGGEERPAHDVLQIDRQVREHFGVPMRAGDMVQPWFRSGHAFPVLGRVALRYQLRVDAGALTALAHAQLVMETPQRFDVKINDRSIDTESDSDWWVDVAFRRLKLPEGVFVQGDNEIVVSCEFAEDVNLEAIYLLGDFAVFLDGVRPRLAELPEKLMPVSVVEQGLPYYSGNITYHYELPMDWAGKLATVEIPSYEGAFAKVVSGAESQMILWRPNRASLTLGETVDIQICITRKNTFGPLHLKDPRPGATGPGHFVPGPSQFSLSPVFIESGLLAPVQLTGYP